MSEAKYLRDSQDVYEGAEFDGHTPKTEWQKVLEHFGYDEDEVPYLSLKQRRDMIWNYRNIKF